MKTSDLTGFALDWAVAQCEGVTVDYVDDGINRCLLMSMGGRFNPSTNWAQGGPIIEREGMQLSMEDRAEWRATMWWDDADGQREVLMKGPTPLVAAMRCYVAASWGDDVPAELTTGKP
jgi:hypothetical protein